MNHRITWRRPAWTDPLVAPAPYKGAPGGRSRGASHFFAGAMVLAVLEDPSLRAVCIREVQRSLRYSAKTLIEDKIRGWGLEGVAFEILNTEIRRIGGDGVIIFEGMQNHTVDSLKSLENFRVWWLEEAQNITRHSMEILLPTIRSEGSELWASWNPDQPDDAIEDLLIRDPPDGAVVAHATYLDLARAGLCPQRVIDQAERMRRLDPEGYAHVWLGGYNVKSDAQVFGGRYRVDEFEPTDEWDGPYQGLDFGFSQDPTFATRWWRWDGRLFAEYESSHIGLELDRTAQTLSRDIPDFADYVTRADSARPESISYLKRHGLPKVEAVTKWSGSVEDGVEWMKAHEEIVVHPRCPSMADEFRLYRYKTNRAGDVLAKLEDDHNHGIDSGRYAFQPLIKPGPKFRAPFSPSMVGT